MVTADNDQENTSSFHSYTSPPPPPPPLLDTTPENTPPQTPTLLSALAPPPPPPPLFMTTQQNTPPQTPPRLNGSSQPQPQPPLSTKSSSSFVEELSKNEAYNRNRNFVNGGVNKSSRSDHSSYVSAATIRNLDDKWIQIQKNTFTNWINEQLKHENGLAVSDLKFDFLDGVKLVKLVDSLQKPNSKVSRRYFKKPINQHQNLENITLALNAITEDGIKLVNIGNVDIANGNLKLILGLIWHLILRYQIGKTKIPPKKLILAWIKSVLPRCQISNLTSDLNDGIVLA